MNLQPVNASPRFSYFCIVCRCRFTSFESQPIADLDGEPFQSYYCTRDGNALAMKGGAQHAVI